MADFKQRFGLDYLTNRPETSKPPASRDLTLPPGLGDAVIAYSGRILGALNGAPQQTIRLFDIARQISTRVDTLLPVINVLINQGYIERTLEDPVGDDTFRLTDAGRKIAP